MNLPRQATSVTTARHTLVNALSGIGVSEDCRDGIAVALSEACSNAVEHARMGQGFDVIVTLDRTRCVVDVIDAGVGLDMRRLDGRPIDVTATRGRGLHLIRAFTDGLEMRRVDPHGLALRMTKTLTWMREAPSRWTDVGQDPWSVVQP
jgi:serine/threonine-protein kinase RsbW